MILPFGRLFQQELTVQAFNRRPGESWAQWWQTAAADRPSAAPAAVEPCNRLGHTRQGGLGC